MQVWENGLQEPLMKFLMNPGDINSIQKMFEIYSQDEAVQRAVEKDMFRDEGFKALFETWYEPQKYTLEELAALPEGTFGKVYADHMIKNKLDLEFISPFKGRNILCYLWFRASHVHDIGHVLTGFDTSFLGEIGIKGFELAQYSSAASAAILGGGLLGVTARKPELVRPAFEALVRGYEFGKKYPLVMGIKWDQEWSTPLSELRAKYSLPTNV